MKKSQAEAAIDAAAVASIGKIFDRLVGRFADGDPKEWAKREIAEACDAFDVMHEAIADLAFDPEDGEKVPRKVEESDHDFRARLLESVDVGSIHRKAAETAIGGTLDELAGLYGLKRGDVPKKGAA